MSKSSNHDGSSDLGLDVEDDYIISCGSAPANSKKPNPKEAKWDVGDSVLVKYNDTKFYYEAKIICVTIYDDQPSYKITYPGWGSTFNEEVVHEDAVDRFKEFTEENRRKSKEEIAQASSSKSKKRKSRVSGVSNNSFSSSEVGGSSSKKPKNGFSKSPSVTDTPVSSFKSVSQKMKPRNEKKLPSVEVEKKLPSPKVEKKHASSKVEKKQSTPKAEKKKQQPTPKVEEKQTLPKVANKQPSPSVEVKQSSPEVKEQESLREIKPIPLTEKLNKIYREDRRLVVEEDMLPNLPAEFPIRRIMEQYVDSLEKSSRKEGTQFSKIILSRFQPNTVALNVYMFEVAMVEDLLLGKSGFEGLRSKELEKEDTATGIPKDFTLLFGVAYILRLLANFHIIAVKDSLLTQKDLALFDDSTAKFVKFLDDHSDEYHKGEKGYYPASVRYCTREKSCV